MRNITYTENMISDVKLLATRKAAMTRHHGPDHPLTLELSGRLRTAMLRQAIRDGLATLPPMNDEEKAELIALLLAE